MHERRSPRAGVIAASPPLDFDHVRAEITQQHRAVGASQRFGKFDDADSAEDWLHSGNSRTFPLLSLCWRERRTCYLAIAKSSAASFSVAGTELYRVPRIWRSSGS